MEVFAKHLHLRPCSAGCHFPGPHTVMCNVAVPNVPKHMINANHTHFSKGCYCVRIPTLTENKMVCVKTFQEREDMRPPQEELVR